MEDFLLRLLLRAPKPPNRLLPGSVEIVSSTYCKCLHKSADTTIGKLKDQKKEEEKKCVSL